MHKREAVAFEPGALSIPDAARYCAIGVEEMRKEINAGKIDARKNGRRTVVLVASLKAWLEALPKR
jgi:Helix-turn-helix domain